MIDLRWDGKYDANGRKSAPLRLALPFQTVETVNASAADRTRTLDLFAEGKPADWRNRLIWGDKRYVLPSLLPDLAGKVNLVYIDPPFVTGSDFSFTTAIPDSGESLTKAPSILEQKAYRDTWGRGLDSYLQWFYETAVLLRDLLADDGSIYVHLDWHVGHYAKVVLDEVFGYDNFRNEIVWKSSTAGSSKARARRFAANHENILVYTKSENYIFNKSFGEYPESEIEKRFNKSDERGRYKDAELATYSQKTLQKLKDDNKLIITSGGKYRYKIYLDDVEGVLVDSVWSDIPIVNSQAEERLNYATQKPEALLERIIRASSNEGDLVLDCFCGSGTTAAVAEKLGRRWVTCDLGRFAVHTARKRLLGIPGVSPFVVQNLGKYERQAWQAAEFGSPEAAAARQAAYRAFVLQMYRAQPLAAGGAWLHGAKNGRLVHVGSVDSPVTASDLSAIAAEFRTLQGHGAESPTQNGVDVLGWEFAFDLNETARQQASAAKLDVRFVRIPREIMEPQAAKQGDVAFHEMGALGVDVAVAGKRVTVRLTDFIVAPDGVPEDVRRAVTHWSQWIDYWAVDWDHEGAHAGDTFHNMWQAYRTKKDPKLPLEAVRDDTPPGRYRIVVKAIDLLGNDTTRTVEVEVPA